MHVLSESLGFKSRISDLKYFMSICDRLQNENNFLKRCLSQRVRDQWLNSLDRNPYVIGYSTLSLSLIGQYQFIEEIKPTELQGGKLVTS